MVEKEMNLSISIWQGSVTVEISKSDAFGNGYI